MKGVRPAAVLVALVILALGASTAFSQKPVVRWVDQPRGALDRVIEERFVATFNASHPGAELKVTRQEDHEKFIRLAIQAGNAPDIIQTNGPAEVVDLARAGKIIPLDAYAKKYGWEEKFLPWAYQSGVVGGKLYSVPQTYESMLLYYNKEAFAQQGLTVPRSAADIESVCRKAHDKGLICFANTTGGKASRGEWWIGWHLNAGAGPRALYRALKGEVAWATLQPQFERNANWIKQGWYGGRPDIYFGPSHDENWSLVGSGKALMRVSGSWDLGRMLKFCKDRCDWAVAPSLAPGVPEHFELAIGETLSISADSKNPDLAAEVLNHLFNDRRRAAGIIEASSFSAWLVPLRWQASDFSGEADPRLVRFITNFSEVTAQGRIGYTTWTFFPPKTRTYLFESFESVLVNKLAIDAFAAGIQPIFDKEAAATPPLPEPKP